MAEEWLTTAAPPELPPITASQPPEPRQRRSHTYPQEIAQCRKIVTNLGKI